MTADDFALARNIKSNYHGLTYLADMGKQIQAQLLAYPEDTDYGRITDLRAGPRTAYTVRRRNVAASTRRSLDHEGFAAKCPALYRRAVSFTAPSRKFGIYFPRSKVDLWTQIKEQAVEGVRAYWADRTQAVDWTNRAAITRVLFDVRQNLRRADERNEALRDQLSESFASAGRSGLVFVPDGSGFEYVDAKLMDPKRVVDWDFITAHSAAQEFVKRNPVRGFQSIAFVEIVPDPEEGDDSDDSARGIWKG